LRLSLFTLLLLLIVTVAQAETIKVVEENDTIILMVNVQDKDGLGSFSLTLKYNPNMTKILKVSWEQPFTVVSNVNNTAGIARIAGFHGQIPGPKGEVKLVRLCVDGLPEFKITDVKLYDTKGNPLTYPLISTPQILPTTTQSKRTITTIPTVITTSTTAPSETIIQEKTTTTTVSIQHSSTKPIEHIITQTQTPKDITKTVTTTLATYITHSTTSSPGFSATFLIFVIILTVLLMSRIRKRKY
jgi:hypothetical protein